MDIVAAPIHTSERASMPDPGIQTSPCGQFVTVSSNQRGTTVNGYEATQAERALNLATRALQQASVDASLELRMAEPEQLGFLPLLEARLVATNVNGDEIKVSIRCKTGSEEPAELVFYDPHLDALPEVTTDLEGNVLESRRLRYNGSTDFALDASEMPAGFLKKSA